MTHASRSVRPSFRGVSGGSCRKGGLMKRAVAALVGIVLGAVAFALPQRAEAWKPYTHNYSGDLASADAADDGMVDILGRDYVVPPRVVLALQQKRPWYNAGVVGPD